MVGAICGDIPPTRPAAPLGYPEQDFLLALTEPSLQMKMSPRQPATPPLLPLQGVFAASAKFADSEAARRSKIAPDQRLKPRRTTA